MYVDIIPEMNITFISNLDDMTYSHYLTVPKQLIEWSMIKLLKKS